jgi:hypothetical protein
MDQQKSLKNRFKIPLESILRTFAQKRLAKKSARNLELFEGVSPSFQDLA